MIRLRTVILLAVLLMLLAVSASAAAQAPTPGSEQTQAPISGTAPRLECSFDVEQVAWGEEAVLSVLVWDVQDLFAYQIELAYDPDQFTIVDADPQVAGVNADLKDFLRPDLVIYNEADNSAGLVSIGASASFPTEPVSGSGMLAQVRVRGSGEGPAEFRFASVTLADENAAVFAAETSGCTLEILPSGAPVTEESAAVMAGETEAAPVVATSVARIVASLEPTPGDTPTPAVTAEPEPQPRLGFATSLLVGFGIVIGLAGVILAVLWLLARSR